MTKTKNVAKQALLSSNYWVINKIIVKKFGIEAAFLLSVFAEAENMMADPDGWFYQTIEKTEEITTLTRWKQEQAIKKLIAENLLEQVAKGMPRKRYYRINYEVLTNLFASDLQAGLRVAYKQECEPLTTSKESSYIELNNKEHTEPEVQAVLNEFIQNRKQMKSPMTNLAIKKLVNNLKKLGNSKEEQIMILERSIANGWKGIFPLDEKDKQKLKKQIKKNKPEEIPVYMQEFVPEE